MHISHEKPPIWDQAVKVLGVKEDEVVFFTYGNTCYNPTGTELTDDLIRHEETHVEQQMADPEVAKLWWERFFRDPVFRLDQEAEAYGAQYKFICQKVKDREKRMQNLFGLAKLLSGPLYGSIISQGKAIQLIREYAEALPHYEAE